MENTRFTRGMEQLKAIDGNGGENVIKSLEDIAPDLGKFIVESVKCCICGKKGICEKRTSSQQQGVLQINPNIQSPNKPKFIKLFFHFHVRENFIATFVIYLYGSFVFNLNL